jgi:hypothetical protein
MDMEMVDEEETKVAEGLALASARLPPPTSFAPTLFEVALPSLLTFHTNCLLPFVSGRVSPSLIRAPS